MSCNAIFGVQSTFGLTAPVGAVVRRARRTRTVEWEEVEGANSEIARACPISYGREVVEISGRGVVAIASLVPSFVVMGTPTIRSRKITEFNTKEPEFEIQAVTLFSTNPPTP